MSWKDLLAAKEPDDTKLQLPWLGGKKVYGFGRSYRIEGKRPRQHGWFVFALDGRKARLLGPSDGPDPNYENEHPRHFGYLAGSRFILDTARVDSDPDKLVDQTEQAHCVERGLERFTRAVMVRTDDGQLVYIRQEFPLGPEFEVQAAYQDRRPSVHHIKEVTPALDLAFRWETQQRELTEERKRLQAEEAKKEAAEERRRQAAKDIGTGAGRRALAQRDFKAAAQAALKISGAELLDHREGLHPNEIVVQYKFRDRRLECVCHRDTLRIIEAGVCLDNHKGTKGDTRFTLESLPGVIGAAIDQGVLVVWRHVPGDRDFHYENRW